jgi:predicted phage-related endonuclease
MSRFILSPHAQGTEEWLADRLGKATGSNADCVIAKGRGNAESTTRRNYLHGLACERLTGKSAANTYKSRRMEHGTEQEPFARMEYEARTGAMVEEAGFAYLPTIPAGCSVDGFIDDRKGIIECKAPLPAIHLSYMARKDCPPEYVPQITHEFWVTGAEYCDFISYCPDMPEKLQLHVLRISRDEKAVKAYEVELLVFLGEVAALEADLRRRAA